MTTKQCSKVPKVSLSDRLHTKKELSVFSIMNISIMNYTRGLSSFYKDPYYERMASEIPSNYGLNEEILDNWSVIAYLSVLLKRDDNISETSLAEDYEDIYNLLVRPYLHMSTI